MTRVKSSHADLTALIGGEPPEDTGGAAVAGRRTTGGRRRKEKKPLSSTDGRRLRGLGRDRQWPAKVTQDLWDAADDACARFDLTKAELTERAMRFYIQALEDGSVGPHE